MALSGELSTKVKSNKNLLLSWTGTQDEYANTTTVKWSVKIVAPKATATTNISIYKYSLKINGTEVASIAKLLKQHKDDVISSGETVITHDENGVQSLSVDISTFFTSSTSSTYKSSAAENWTLDSIDRTSTPSVNNKMTSVSYVTIGEKITIYTNKKSTFTHKITVSFGIKSLVLSENCVDSYEWTGFTVANYAGQIPNSDRGDLIVTVDTIRGSTVIGSKSISVPAILPDNIKPSLSVTCSNSNNTFNCWAQYVSGFKIKPTVTTLYSATIKDITISATDMSNKSAKSGTEYTFDAFQKTGSKTISVIAIDSRGRTATWSQTITVVAYSYPTVTLSVSRGSGSTISDFVKDDIGSVAKADLYGTVYNISGNTLTPTLRYRNIGGTSWQYVTVSSATTQLNTSVLFNADDTKSYEVQLIITDKAGLSVTASMTLSNGFVPLDFFKGGGGVAMGKTATQNGFDCAMVMRILNNSAGGNGQSGWYYNDSGTQVQKSNVYASSDGFHLSVLSGKGFLDGTWSGTLSDSRMKRDIDPIAREIILAVGEVPLYQFRMSAPHYDHDVLCVGILAQDLKSAFEKHGVKDKLLMLDTVKLDSTSNEEYYCIEYTHFLIVRLLYDELRIEEFDKRLKAIESKLL